MAGNRYVKSGHLCSCKHCSWLLGQFPEEGIVSEVFNSFPLPPLPCFKTPIVISASRLFSRDGSLPWLKEDSYSPAHCHSHSWAPPLGQQLFSQGTPWETWETGPHIPSFWCLSKVVSCWTPLDPRGAHGFTAFSSPFQGLAWSGNHRGPRPA